MDREYLVLIGFNVFTEKSGDWIDRVEVVKTDRKYLLVVIKEPLWFIRHRSHRLTEIFKCLTKEMEQYDKILDGFLKEMRIRDDGKENG